MVSQSQSARVRASKTAILEAAQAILCQAGGPALTLDAVAGAVGCAKGLVHYHFESKTGLLARVAAHLAVAREAAWLDALRAEDPQEAIDRSWTVLQQEAALGTQRAWNALLAMSEPEIARIAASAAERLRQGIAQATEELMIRAGLEPAVPTADLGWLLAAILDGMAAQLESGADAVALENAYVTAWAAILSLTAPVPD